MADDAVGGGGDDSRHRRPTYTQEAPDVSRQRGAGRPQAPPAEGPEGVKARIAVHQNALEGYWDVQEIHSAGDRVVVRWIGRGTHTGELMGVPATGATVEVEAITILRIADQQIAEEWTVWDALGLLQQVGAVPVPA